MEEVINDSNLLKDEDDVSVFLRNVDVSNIYNAGYSQRQTKHRRY